MAGHYPIRIDPIAGIVGGKFELHVTLTFAAGPDPFALDLDAAESLLVTLAGHDLLRETGPIAAGQTLRVPDIQGVLAGSNEFYVRAIAQEDNVDMVRGLRVRLLRDDQPVAEQSLWSEPGQPVEGVIRVDVPARQLQKPTNPQAASSGRAVRRRLRDQVALR